MADPEKKPYHPSAVGNPSVLARRNWWQTQLVNFLVKHTPKCREVTRLLSRSMDEPLPLTTRCKIRLHFLICCWCQRYAEQLGRMRQFAQRLSDHACDTPGGETLPGDAKERLKNALRDAGASSGDPR